MAAPRCARREANEKLLSSRSQSCESPIRKSFCIPVGERTTCCWHHMTLPERRNTLAKVVLPALLKISSATAISSPSNLLQPLSRARLLCDEEEHAHGLREAPADLLFDHVYPPTRLRQNQRTPLRSSIINWRNRGLTDLSLATTILDPGKAPATSSALYHDAGDRNRVSQPTHLRGQSAAQQNPRSVRQEFYDSMMLIRHPRLITKPLKTDEDPDRLHSSTPCADPPNGCLSRYSPLEDRLHKTVSRILDERVVSAQPPPISRVKRK